MKDLTSRSEDKHASFDKDSYRNAFKTMLKNDDIIITVFMRVYKDSEKEKKGVLHLNYFCTF